MTVLNNQALIAALAAWTVAQTIKLPIDYAQTRRWDWSLLFRAGGMPSSHSALVTATAHGIGMTEGFDSPLFALAIAVAMVVIYDATGIRRQAGRHAEFINTLVSDLLEGHPLSQETLREVLGHSPTEALAGIALGLITSTLVINFWPA